MGQNENDVGEMQYRKNTKTLIWWKKGKTLNQVEDTTKRQSSIPNATSFKLIRI